MNDLAAHALGYADVDPFGCWLWTASTCAYGYGQLVTGSDGEQHSHKAHRVVYEAMVGPIPTGLELDHLCRTRHCVNPLHLEPVTRKVNIARGYSPTAVNGRKTECHRGHPFDAANTLVRRDGTRQCRTCNRERMRKAA